jgi:hypothetical protein
VIIWRAGTTGAGEGERDEAVVEEDVAEAAPKAASSSEGAGDEQLLCVGNASWWASPGEAAGKPGEAAGKPGEAVGAGDV